METYDKNLQKLEQLLKIIDEGVTKEEFVKAFENVVQLLLKMEKRNTEAVDNLEKTYKLLIEKIKNDSTSSLNDLKKQVDNVFIGKQLEKILSEHNQRMLKIDEIGIEHTNKISLLDERIKNIKDGYTPIKGKDYFDGVSADKITSVEVRDRLEMLKGEDRLDVSAIKGLDEYIKSNKDIVLKGAFMVGGKARNSVHIYDISDQLNGVLKTFNLPSNFGIVGVWCSSMPNAFRPTIDYTEGNKTITFTSEINAATTLAAGQTVILQYIR